MPGSSGTHASRTARPPPPGRWTSSSTTSGRVARITMIASSTSAGLADDVHRARPARGDAGTEQSRGRRRGRRGQRDRRRSRRSGRVRHGGAPQREHQRTSVPSPGRCAPWPSRRRTPSGRRSTRAPRGGRDHGVGIEPASAIAHEHLDLVRRPPRRRPTPGRRRAWRRSRSPRGWRPRGGHPIVERDVADGHQVDGRAVGRLRRRHHLGGPPRACRIARRGVQPRAQGPLLGARESDHLAGSSALRWIRVRVCRTESWTCAAISARSSARTAASRSACQRACIQVEIHGRAIRTSPAATAPAAAMDAPVVARSKPRADHRDQPQQDQAQADQHPDPALIGPRARPWPGRPPRRAPAGWSPAGGHRSAATAATTPAPTIRTGRPQGDPDGQAEGGQCPAGRPVRGRGSPARR